MTARNGHAVVAEGVIWIVVLVVGFGALGIGATATSTDDGSGGAGRPGGQIRRDPARHRFEAVVDGRVVGIAEYRLGPDESCSRTPRWSRPTAAADRDRPGADLVGLGARAWPVGGPGVLVLPGVHPRNRDYRDLVRS